MECLSHGVKKYMRIRVVPNFSSIFRTYVTVFSTNRSNVARALYVNLSESFDALVEADMLVRGSRVSIALFPKPGTFAYQHSRVSAINRLSQSPCIYA